MSSVKEGIVIYDPLTELVISLPLGGIYGDLVTTGNAQIIFNKDLTDPSNRIRATQLGTAGADVIIDGSPQPPGPGYILETTSATTAEWILNNTNTDAANVGTSGVGVYRDKTSDTLNFKKLRTTTRLSVLDDLLTDTVLFDVNESNLLLQNLGGTLSIAHGGTGATTVDGAVANLNLTKQNVSSVAPMPTDDSSLGYTEGSTWVDTTTNIIYFLVDATPGAAVWSTGGSSVYTASNVNVGGIGTFKQLAGSDFEFRGINSASSKVSVTLDVPNNEIDIDIVQGQIDHDSLLNYSANRHIDHSAVSITAGTGLSGGGDITTTRTLNVDITGLVLETVVDSTNDLLLLYDASSSTHKKVHPGSLPGASGEANTGSNVNVGGVGVFKQKTGVNLEFKGIVAASNKITIGSDVPNNTITIDAAPGNIDHNSLLNYSANEHVDHSSVSITAGTGLSGGGNITASRTLNIDIPTLALETVLDPANDLLIMYDASTSSHKKIHPSILPNEIITGSNVGVGGVGVFKQKTGTNFEFRNVIADSSKVTVTLDAPNNEIGVDIVENQIDHNSLLNYSANRHVDHSAVSVSTAANSGLSGGGDITATRSIVLDVNNLVTDAAPDFATDYVPTYDSSASTTKKILLSKLTDIDSYHVTGTSTVSISSTTYFTIPGMTVTPAAGTYTVLFSSMAEGDTNNRTYRYGVFKNGTIVTGSYRDIKTTNNAQRAFSHSICTEAVVTANGTDTIDIRYSVNVAAATFTVYERSMTLTRLAQ